VKIPLDSYTQTAVVCHNRNYGRFKIMRVLTSVITGALLVSCVSAQRSREIMPEFIPPSNYAGMSCEDTTVLLAFKQDEETALSAGQDTIGTGLLGLVNEIRKGSNNDRENAIAKVKGEVNALRGAVMANCN
jgi:hypothetical protein